MQSSQDLVRGRVYTRAELKAKFGIADASINNGIFRPKGHDSVWLFVTKNKTADRTQYHDSLDGDELTMQGQTSGRTDHWITGHESAGVELLLFYRDSKFEHPSAGFVYEGPFYYRGHEGTWPATFVLKRGKAPIAKRKRTWERALAAVIGLGGRATPTEVRDYILARDPDYNISNVEPDLLFLSVNSPSRTSFHHNERPRRTDGESDFDKLFKIGSGKGVTFELYDQAQHGVWEIFKNPAATNSSGMSIRQIISPTARMLDEAEREAEAQGAFDAHNVEDARHRVIASIVRRHGQAEFRKLLMEAYGGACAVTGCSLKAILDAAHVHPYRGVQTNVVSNGLLLRTDVHTLFDLGLIAVESDTLLIRVSPELAGTEYADLDGKKLKSTASPHQQISAASLDWHRSRCGW
jgi:hypothetical protein